MRRYRELLTIPGVGRLTASVLLSRVSTSMLNLALLVATTQRYGYAAAGVILMVFALATAVAGPVRGRLADKHEPRRVLLVLLAGHTVAWAGLFAGLVAGAPLLVLCLAAAALGISVPPAGPVVRGLWPTIVPEEQLPTAYAFDAALNTSTFLAGPMIAGGLLLLMPAPAVVGVTGGIKLLGDLLVAIAPALRGRRGGHPPARGFFGPLRHGRVRLLLGMIVLDTFAFGCLEVAAVAAASGQGTAGVFTSAMALGAVVSGIGYGARTWPGLPRTQLVVLHAGGAVVLVGAGLAGAVLIVLVVVAYVVYGLVNGPVETLQQVLVGDATPDGQRIEAFAWVFSVMWAGFGIGTTVAGRLVDDGEPAGALYAAAAAQVLVVLVALAGMRRPHDRDT
ncbi:MFS transporter [Actinophytocola algeriensis]|uniref:MFS family permease n=1 Tax=Actinophytocola algeriensis TaxID=1768010 RepID=A0A7W7Q6R9_9PSEU|nr:MFS transporter [Actinophytocola algeriensis]MBB4908090.1 MFS family permease [Actinophytocola algeriensis]MBE1480120.1 MFS family permease [Actinophytocola algeriensis]